MSESNTSHVRALVTTTKGGSEQRTYEVTSLGALSRAHWPHRGLAQRDAPIVLRAAPGKRGLAFPTEGALVAEGSNTPSVLWGSSLAIAPVSMAEGFITALDLLRQVLLSAPSFMGLMLLGHGVQMPHYHTPASLAKLRIGVRESAQRDVFALANEAHETLERARAEEQEAVTHYRNFATELRERLRNRHPAV